MEKKKHARRRSNSLAPHVDRTTLLVYPCPRVRRCVLCEYYIGFSPWRSQDAGWSLDRKEKVGYGGKRKHAVVFRRTFARNWRHFAHCRSSRLHTHRVSHVEVEEFHYAQMRNMESHEPVQRLKASLLTPRQLTRLSCPCNVPTRSPRSTSQTLHSKSSYPANNNRPETEKATEVIPHTGSGIV